MALILADRVRETTNTTGTGAVTLAGAITGYQAFSAVMADTDTCYYTIAGQNTSEWEVGLGTYASGGNTLTRTTVYASSNSGSAVSFSSGAKDVFITYPAERAAYASNSPTTSGYVLTANGTGTAPSWQSAGSSAATPTTLGTVYGLTVSGSENTSLGWHALNSISAGATNVGIGAFAGESISNGVQNVAIGGSCLRNVTTGSYNVAIGDSSMGNAATGVSNNVAIGMSALRLTTASSNVAVGYYAGYNNSSGTYNSYVGYQAGYSGTTGVARNAQGYQALYSATTGSQYSDAMGYKALYASNASGANVGIGAFAGYQLSTGFGNTLVGSQIAGTMTTAGRNTAMGQEALSGCNSDNNTAIGYSAGFAITSGANNTLLGYNAGATGTNNLTTGSNNILIGYSAEASSATVSNEFTHGNSSITSNRFWGDFKMGGSSAGTAGQVLTSQGAGVAPIWAAGGGGSSLPITKMQAQSFGGF